MGRNILFVTTDEQRCDGLGCYGGRIARTPVADRLASQGVLYERAYTQNVTCMPARSTIVTGQHVNTHGVFRNGYSLPESDPSVAELLKERAGYRTALVGKAHWQPMVDPTAFEASAATRGEHGPYRGFDHLSLAVHSAHSYRCVTHYSRWMADNHAEHVESFYPPVGPKNGPNNLRGGETRAIQVHRNDCPRELYHTDWVADRALDWLATLGGDDDWFLWVSFPDPHHPFDPPRSELGRVNWRDFDLPPGHPGSHDKIVALLSKKPRHWLEFYLGKADIAEETPDDFVPSTMTGDNVREINAMVHVQNELIDEALGRIVGWLESRGWAEETDIFFTTDHGTAQGDFGLMFKGPFHVDALMRLPLIWRPAPSAGLDVAGTRIDDPVGHVDLAPTLAAIAGLDAAPWMEGAPLPLDPSPERDHAICQWDAEKAGLEIRLRSVYDRSGFLCTAYAPTNYYHGGEGELYDVHEDPRQWVNLWDDPGYRAVRDELVEKIREGFPEPRYPPLMRRSRT